jgi:excinuclease ABC subunit C
MADGELDKKHYRSFNVRGEAMSAAAQGRLNDDYGAMYEVLARRFRRAIKAGELPETTPVPPPVSAPAPAPAPAPATVADSARGFGGGSGSGAGSGRHVDDSAWEAPDLFVVDGGRGQLAVALAAAHDLGLHDLAVVALAKERENVLGETLTDRVYLPGQKNPIPLKSGTTSLFLLARLRDEAHRFSNRARLRLGKKRRMRSPLDDVKGLGDKAKKALLSHVGNLAAIRAADDATLLAVPGIAPRHLRALRTAFPPASTPTSLTDLHPALPTQENKRQPS